MEVPFLYILVFHNINVDPQGAAAQAKLVQVATAIMDLFPSSTDDLILSCKRMNSIRF